MYRASLGLVRLYGDPGHTLNVSRVKKVQPKFAKIETPNIDFPVL